MNIGTVGTMPPERFLEIKHYEYAYDVWSAACVIYSIATGGKAMIPNSSSAIIRGIKGDDRDSARAKHMLCQIVSVLGTEIPKPKKNMISST